MRDGHFEKSGNSIKLKAWNVESDAHGQMSNEGPSVTVFLLSFMVQFSCYIKTIFGHQFKNVYVE